MKEPWYYEGRKGWYVHDWIDGTRRKVRIGDTKKEAYENWRKELNRREQLAGMEPTFNVILAVFSNWLVSEVEMGSLAVGTVEGYLFYCRRFAEVVGDLSISEITPAHVTDWFLKNSQWGTAGRRGALSSLNRMLNWAAREKRIKENPIAGMRKPPQKRRDTLLDEDLHRQLILAVRDAKNNARIDRQFQLALIAIRHCGGRPQDVANVRVEHVSKDFKTWTIPIHKRLRHTSKPKVVYLSPCLQTITRILAAGRTEGPLFRGRRGGLSVNAIGCRLKRIKEQTSIDSKVVAYSYRHTYITDALQRGVGIATVAELVGTSVAMIQKHYGHLEQRGDHLANAARKAMGGE